MSDATLVIDGDTTRLVGSAKKGETALKKMGDGASAAGRQMEAAGKKMEHAGKQMEQAGRKSDEAFGKSLINAARVVTAMRQVVGAVRAMGDSLSGSLSRAGQISEGKGAAMLRAGQVGAEMGMDPKLVSSLMRQTNAASDEDKAALLEGIAKDGGATPQRTIELFSALGSGAFSLNQVMEAQKSGESLNVAEQLAKLPQAALREINTRRQVNAVKAQEGAFDGGTVRVGAAVTEAEDRRDPGRAALRAIIPSIAAPFQEVKGLDQATRMRDSELSVLKGIRNATEKAANAKRLNTTGITDSQ